MRVFWTGGVAVYFAEKSIISMIYFQLDRISIK